MDNGINETLQLILQTVNSKFTELNDKMDKGFKDVNSRIDSIDKRLTKVELNVETIKDNQKVLAEGVAANTEKLKEMDKKIDNLSSKVEKNDIEIKVIKGGKYKAN